MTGLSNGVAILSENQIENQFYSNLAKHLLEKLSCSRLLDNHIAEQKRCNIK
jgi:hypothetical protein